MDILAKLNEKIDGLLKNYENLKKENEDLKTEIETLNSKIDEKETELVECKENMALKELELEEILAKLEGILGK